MQFEKEYMQLITQFCKWCLPCSSISNTGIMQNNITSAVPDDPEDVGEVVITTPVELSLPIPA